MRALAFLALFSAACGGFTSAPQASLEKSSQRTCPVDGQVLRDAKLLGKAPGSAQIVLKNPDEFDTSICTTRIEITLEGRVQSKGMLFYERVEGNWKLREEKSEMVDIRRLQLIALESYVGSLCECEGESCSESLTRETQEYLGREAVSRLSTDSDSDAHALFLQKTECDAAREKHLLSLALRLEQVVEELCACNDVDCVENIADRPDLDELEEIAEKHEDLVARAGVCIERIEGA